MRGASAARSRAHTQKVFKSCRLAYRNRHPTTAERAGPSSPPATRARWCCARAAGGGGCLRRTPSAHGFKCGCGARRTPGALEACAARTAVGHARSRALRADSRCEPPRASAGRGRGRPPGLLHRHAFVPSPFEVPPPARRRPVCCGSRLGAARPLVPAQVFAHADALSRAQGGAARALQRPGPRLTGTPRPALGMGAGKRQRGLPRCVVGVGGLRLSGTGARRGALASAGAHDAGARVTSRRCSLTGGWSGRYTALPDATVRLHDRPPGVCQCMR